MAIAAISHIDVDEKGVARVAGTRLKVIHLITAMQADKCDATELQRQYPSVTLAQIHAALSYYYDHKAEIDGEIQASLARAEEEWKKQPVPDFVKRLKADGRI